MNCKECGRDLNSIVDSKYNARKFIFTKTGKKDKVSITVRDEGGVEEALHTSLRELARLEGGYNVIKGYSEFERVCTIRKIEKDFRDSESENIREWFMEKLDMDIEVASVHIDEKKAPTIYREFTFSSEEGEEKVNISLIDFPDSDNAMDRALECLANLENTTFIPGYTVYERLEVIKRIRNNYHSTDNVENIKLKKTKASPARDKSLREWFIEKLCLNIDVKYHK